MKYKLRQNKLLCIASLPLLAAACAASQPASATGPSWLKQVGQAQDTSHPYGGTEVTKYCDTDTGNLIYLSGDYRGGIAVVKDGCK